MTDLSVLYLLPIATVSIVLAASFADLRATQVRIRSGERRDRRR